MSPPASVSTDGERALLRESADRFVARSYAIDERTAVARTDPGYRRDHWATFADLGWLAIVAPEAHGGIGATLADAGALIEPFGNGLLLEPFVDEVVYAGALLAAASDAVAARALTAAVEGTLHVAAATRERGDAFDPQRIATRVTSRDGGLVLEGSKIDVAFGASAGAFVVSAHDDRGDLRLVLVDASASGITVDERIAADGTRRAGVTFARVPLSGDALLDVADPAATLLRAADRARAAACAEATGVIRRALRETAAFVNERVQFGQPIAAFQVVRHRIADMYIEAELASAAAQLALAAADDDGPDRAQRVSLAAYQVARSGRAVCEAAVQLHGAMGIAAESAVAHALARVTVLAVAYGDPTYHLQRYLAPERT
jgi:alkylation response protein AidB-like acyl-CoA dehydrogenase